MISKAITFFTLVAIAKAGQVSYLANPHIGAQSELTLRGFGGLSSVSKQAKAIDSPFSSVRKSDVRVTNDATSVYAAAPAGITYTQGFGAAYAAPAYAAPAYSASAYAAPSFAAPAYAAPVAAAPLGYASPAVAYSSKTISAAPAVAYAPAPALAKVHAAPGAYATAPAIAKVHAAPVTYAGPATYAAPAAYGAAVPALGKVHAAPAGLLGVAYSPVSPAVATLNFNGYGISYGY